MYRLLIRIATNHDGPGNMLSQQHLAATGWTRSYTLYATNNRLRRTTLAGVTQNYNYDTRGNMTGGLPHLTNGSGGLTSTMRYNEENRLDRVIQNANVTIYYQYDSAGQRVRKTLKNSQGTIVETRKYIGGWEVYERKAAGVVDYRRESLQVMDDKERVALVETKLSSGGAVQDQLVRHQYTNHLGTATLELDTTGAIISYEEYYPFGSTSFQSGRTATEVSLKRYRFTGKERDEESGFYYHGARYYIPWLCRWAAVDPINNEWYNASSGQPARNQERTAVEFSASPYEYCYDNPVRFNDPTGEQVPPEQTNTIRVNVNVYKVNTEAQQLEFQYTMSPVDVPTSEEVQRTPVEVSVIQADVPVKRGNMITYETKNIGVYVNPNSGETYDEKFKREDPGVYFLYYLTTKINPLGSASLKFSEAIGGESYTSSTGSTKTIGTAQRATSAATGVVELASLGLASRSAKSLRVYSAVKLFKEGGEILIDGTLKDAKEKEIAKYLLGLTLFLPFWKSGDQWDKGTMIAEISLQSAEFAQRQLKQSKERAQNKNEAVSSALQLLNIALTYGK